MCSNNVQLVRQNRERTEPVELHFLFVDFQTVSETLYGGDKVKGLSVSVLQDYNTPPPKYEQPARRPPLTLVSTPLQTLPTVSTPPSIHTVARCCP